MVLWVHRVRAHAGLQPLYARPHSHWADSTLSAVCDDREQLKAAGLMSEVFTFVDATHLIAEAAFVGRTG